MYDDTMPHRDGLSEEIVIETMKEQDWPVTSKKLGEKLGTTQQNAYKHLRKLWDKERVERKKYGVNVVLWRPKNW
jgi:predicted ArsR family transcriptional regulator